MSDYSDEDFEMSGSGTVGTFNSKKDVPSVRASNLNNPSNLRGKSNASPFTSKPVAPAKSNNRGFTLADDDDDDGNAPKGQGVNSGDDYEDDDFDQDEEEQFKQTAVEFANKLTQLRESSKYELAEGGEDPAAANKSKAREESKRNGGGSSSLSRPYGNNYAAAGGSTMSPP